MKIHQCEKHSSLLCLSFTRDKVNVLSDKDIVTQGFQVTLKY